MARRTGRLFSILTALPLWADMLVPHGPPGPPGPPGPSDVVVRVPAGPGEAAVLTGLILALVVIVGGIWWVRRRRKRA
jgi:hypothetical protein